MSLSICINCGDNKSSPMSKCPNCGLVPISDNEKAKSLILSLDYEIEGSYKGQSKERLKEIGELIKQKRFNFDDSEVGKVVAYARAVQSIPASTLLRDLVKWVFWPGVLVALMVFVLLLRR